jgi:hypothetical protein
MFKCSYARQLPPGITAVVIIAVSLRFIGAAAIRTTFRLIGEALGLVEILFAGGECEGSSAIGTL